MFVATNQRSRGPIRQHAVGNLFGALDGRLTRRSAASQVYFQQPGIVLGGRCKFVLHFDTVGGKHGRAQTAAAKAAPLTTPVQPKHLMFDLTERVALITGGSRGIGRAAAAALAQQGAEVILGYVANEAAATAAAEQIHVANGKADIVRFDVADPVACEQAAQQLAKDKGRLDILVASAGIAIDGLLMRLKAEDFDRMMAVNVRGALATAKGCIRPMMRAKHGRIVFLSSVVGDMGNAGQTAYAATKAALQGAAKSIAKEYAMRGITVNCVAPGFIDTDMTGGLAEEQKAQMLTAVPMGRTGTPEEVAATILFLASDEAAYVTGQTLRVNGGMYM
jgi:3-oxoacyl-[acyl-carrier protein] reductase